MGPFLGPDLQQLGALVPGIPSPTRESVFLHFQKDGSRALDALLGMSSPTQRTPPYTEHQVRARVRVRGDAGGLTFQTTRLHSAPPPQEALENHPPVDSSHRKHHFCSSDKVRVGWWLWEPRGP